MPCARPPSSAGRDPDDLTICVAAPAYVGDDMAHMRDQCRWFGGMVGNHVADIVCRYGADGAGVPHALTDYIEGRKGYDYAEHGRAGNSTPSSCPTRSSTASASSARSRPSSSAWPSSRRSASTSSPIYLQHDAMDETLEAYGASVIPALRR